MILPPGAYTAFLKGVGGRVGVGLVEVFEIDGLTNPSKLVNISTRAMVQKSDNRMIGGMIVTGSASKTFLSVPAVLLWAVRRFSFLVFCRILIYSFSPARRW